MVGTRVFRRSASLPVPNPKGAKEKSYHVRSVSLPCRSHPLISQLRQVLSALLSWQSSHATSSADLLRGLTLLDELHGALDELLHLPKIQESLRMLRRSPAWVDQLLEDFLLLADAYGCFRGSLVSLQQILSEAEVAVRRRDEKAISCLARTQRKLEKEIAKVVADLRDVGKQQEITVTDSGDLELVCIMREVTMAIASTSAAVFTGFVTLSTSCFVGLSSPSSGWTVLRKRVKASATKEGEWERRMEGLRTVEECSVGLESGSGRIFRCLVNTRVSLLNILTP